MTSAYPTTVPRRTPRRTRARVPEQWPSSSKGRRPERRLTRLARRAFPARTRSLLPLGPLAAVAVAISGRVTEQRLYEITIPGLSIDNDFRAVRRRLLADFPHVVEVFAMSTPETVLIAYRGEDEIDAWCEALGDAVAITRRSLEQHTGGWRTQDPPPLDRRFSAPGLPSRGSGGVEQAPANDPSQGDTPTERLKAVGPRGG